MTLRRGEGSRVKVGGLILGRKGIKDKWAIFKVCYPLRRLVNHLRIPSLLPSWLLRDDYGMWGWGRAAQRLSAPQRSELDTVSFSHCPRPSRLPSCTSRMWDMTEAFLYSAALLLNFSVWLFQYFPLCPKDFSFFLYLQCLLFKALCAKLKVINWERQWIGSQS